MRQAQNFNFNSIRNNHGQAAVEYILLLVITVGLAIAAKGAFTSLNNFMNHYIGEYTVCLMEYGELPTLNTTNADLSKHVGGSSGGRVCDKQFEPFTLAEGRPPVGSGASASSGSSAGKTKGGSQSGGSGKGGPSDSKSAADNNSALAGQIKNSNSGRKASPYTNGQISRSGAYGTSDAGPEAAGGDKVKVIEEEGQKDGGRYGSNSSRTTRRLDSNEKYRALTGVMAAEIEKRSPQKAPLARISTRTLASDESSRFGPFKKTFTPPDLKTQAQKEDDNSGFSFGNIIRYLIIAGMILALIVFFGGQILNYSNSQE